MKRRLLTAVATVLTLVGVAVAGEPTDSLKTRIHRVLTLLEQSGDHRAEIRKIAEEIFDVEEMSRRALGQHWKARTPEERREFMTLFADLLDRSYISRVESGRGGKVNYAGETVTGDEATVRTQIITPQRTEVPVDYRMHRKDNRWKVYDLNIEGVSLIANYRSQFNSVIQSSSYQALVERLRSKETDAAASPQAPRRSRRD
ncbi:MAG TPA: ABC transporter substrate-binding protein [Methylomirabilota bacterium]